MLLGFVTNKCLQKTENHVLYLLASGMSRQASHRRALAQTPVAFYFLG